MSKTDSLSFVSLSSKGLNLSVVFGTLKLAIPVRCEGDLEIPKPCTIRDHCSFLCNYTKS